MYDLLIIGAGPAGLTAGIYAARSGLKTGILESSIFGGQAALTEKIENYPGFPSGIGGFELMNSFMKQAETFGVEMIYGEARITNYLENVKKITADEQVFETKSIIIASGTKPKKMKVPGEELFMGRGVSYCATCDGAFFKGKKVIVVGGGDSALKEGAYLTKFASEVTIVHRRQGFRASQIVVNNARNNPKIHFQLDCVIEEILGHDNVEGVRIRNLVTGAQEVLPTDGVFVYIGTQPNTQFLPGEIKLDEQGFILTNALLETNVNGIFAAGDVRNTALRQVATAVGDGALAAVEAEKYLEE